MRKLLIFLVLIFVMAVPVCAQEITAPSVPDYAEEFMPANRETFGQGLMEVLWDSIKQFRPDLHEACGVCLAICASVMLVSVMKCFPGMSEKTVNMVGVIAISAVLLQAANSMVNLASKTVVEISEYGKLLLPVMTTALASQGGFTASAALYTGTAIFDSLLTSLIGKIMTPMIYLFLAVSAAGCAIGEDMLKKIKETLKGVIIWSLKTLLYIYTGYMGLTGVISGTTDANALKAAKLTISSVVPVVGGILSDASEAVLVGAGTVKNAVGMYGLFAVIAIWMGPFLRISAHYMILKATGAVCGVFGDKLSTELINDFSSAMGLLLAMTGTICLMLLVSLVCFMRGVG